MAFQGYLRHPSIAGDAIAFTAEDDLWLVSASGGRAERLTAGVAEATHGRLSPDGKQLAFIGRDEGPTEVYVMPTDGGAARRLTYQGVNFVALAGWAPDGASILYVTSAGQFSPRVRKLFSVSAKGGEPSELPYGVAHSIAFGPHGAVVVGRNTADPARWKRYRGGTAGYLWIDPSGEGQFHRLLNLNTNVTSPCWVGDRVYFISDHEGIGNVYSVLPNGDDLRRHTSQSEYYARGLASDGTRLVYHAGADLYLLDPASGADRRVPVELTGARAQRARKFVPAAQYLTAFAPHPRGHSLALATRGKPFSLGNWEGPVRQYGTEEGVRYRLAAWMADGKRIVALADDGREPRLAVLSADPAMPDRVFDTLDVGHVLELRPAPSGDQIAIVNHRNQVVLVDTASGTLKVIDESKHGRAEFAPVGGNRTNRGLAWSPDARWLAYALAVNPHQTAIKVADLTTGQTRQVTDPVLHDMQPAFDPKGRYLYFISARDYDPVQDDMQFELGFPKGIKPYLLTLRKDLPSPFIPAPQAPKSEAAETLDAAKAEEKPAAPGPVGIDFDGIADRIVAFPVAEGRYGRVQGSNDGVLFSSYPVEGMRGTGYAPSLVPEAKGALEGYTFETHKQERILDSISDFEVTPDGKTVAIRAGERIRVLKAGEKPKAEGEAANRPGRESGLIDLDRVKVEVLPPAEWRQMLAEAWRLQREQFWVADMGGVDWPRVFERYAKLVDRVGSRSELSDLMWEMQGELGSSHAYEGGGEYRPHPEYRQGFLGVDWRFDPASGRHTVARVLRGDPWNPDATSPLNIPGANVAPGDAILAVNGQRVTPERGPQQLLVNQAGNEVELLIQPADGSAPRSVVVRASGSEHPARYRDWVEANRRAVSEATGGRAGYLHIPDMGYDGFAEFHRYYLPQFAHDALIVDIRWNGGGMVSGLLLEKLARKRLGYDFQRYGDPHPYLAEAPLGPLVAITDENAGSDGDIFSHAWKMLNLGPLIGKRTWGGVIGIDPYIPLVDGSSTTQPEFSFWFNDVGWGVENYGTDPTIDVDYPPQAYRAGEDPQLARAIAEAKRLLAEHPAAVPQPGPRPNRGFPPRG